MAFLDDKTRADIREVLGELPGTVALKLFTREHDCPTCGDLVQLLGELAATHPSIQLETLDMDRAPGLAGTYGVTQAPTLVVAGAEDRGVRFLGTPAGFEFAALLDAIKAVSRGTSALAPELQQALAGLTRPVDIKVFVTPTCPYCAPAVSTAHQIALASKGVTAQMIETMEFPEMAEAYSVRGVPRIVIDDQVVIEGAIPPRRFVEAVVEASRAA
jgi:glutaredoxin-like protein